MKQECGSCIFQAKVRTERQGPEISCLLDGQWHGGGYSCNYWKEYLELPLAKRIEIAGEFRNSIGSQNRHQESLAVSKEANTIARSAKNAAWWAIGISIVSAIISIIAILKR